MLNISHNKLHKSFDLMAYQSGKKVLYRKYFKVFNKFLIAFSILVFIILFMPWTQNITGSGQVTTLRPDQRPQTLQSPIPGKIERWFVNEGDFVKKGDTILEISEIKSEYFDPNLVSRTGEQIKAKSSSIESYEEKVKAIDRQINALYTEQSLKLEQTRNKLKQALLKVKSDSIDLEASRTQIDIANRQYERVVALQNEGLKSVKDVEEMRLKLQDAQAKVISQENKYLASKNEVLNAEMEISSTQAAFNDKISKAQSDKFTAQSNQFDTSAQVSKLENDYSNYNIRSSLRYVRAPLDGYINKALISGIGETFKEGESLVGVMPAEVKFAVETFVQPLDLPLLHVGEKVRVQFDGWPAIVFSGWPNVSYGTYGAKIVAIENFISPNGKYRVLLAPDESENPWPTAIRAGSGAYTMALLEDVPIWFELWRKINGFPPNFYQPTTKQNEK
uniref:HlyD family secretion protein n=1 Tax=Gelidibacter sp. TaxID=2018083 RepID=UPI00404A0A62